MTSYTHKTQNRLRVRSDYIRHNPSKVAELINKLEQIEGIRHIKHKKYAGSVAIFFCDKSMTCEDLLETLESHGWLQETEKNEFIEEAVKKGTKSLAKGIILLTLRKTLGNTIVKALATI